MGGYWTPEVWESAEEKHGLTPEGLARAIRPLVEEARERRAVWRELRQLRATARRVGVWSEVQEGWREAARKALGGRNLAAGNGTNH